MENGRPQLGIQFTVALRQLLSWESVRYRRDDDAVPRSQSLMRRNRLREWKRFLFPPSQEFLERPFPESWTKQNAQNKKDNSKGDLRWDDIAL